MCFKFLITKTKLTVHYNRIYTTLNGFQFQTPQLQPTFFSSWREVSFKLKFGIKTNT